MTYAGFWKRFAAALVDGIITSIASYAIGLAFGISTVASGSGASSSYDSRSSILGILVTWSYFAAMESSSIQATLGKMALGIKVTDLGGNKIGFGRATGRHFGKIISAFILMIGFIMAAFTEKKQGLHDMMAGCLVVNK